MGIRKHLKVSLDWTFEGPQLVLGFAAEEPHPTRHLFVRLIFVIGARHPQQDVIIAMGFAYRLERIDVDEILLLADLPPLGRSVLREFRQANLSAGSP